MFDLPVETGEQRRAYRKFRKALLKNGFIMLQESVYCRLLTSPTVETSIKNMIRKEKPAEGLVQTLSVTEKQYSKMEFIVGEKQLEIIDSAERVIVL